MSVARKAGEKDKKTRVHNARNARETKRAKNNVKKGKNFFLGAPERSPKKVKKGTGGLRGAKGVALMGREVRLAAVPRVVMRN